MRATFKGLTDRGITPEVGTIVPGSGLSFGVSGRDAHLGDSGVGVETSALWSIRGYQLYTAQIGLLAERHAMFELRPADANLAELFGDRRALETGLAVYVDLRYRDHPRVDFFGISGNAPGEHANFGVTVWSSDVVVQWQHSPALGVSGRVGVIDLNLGPGSNPNLPDVSEVFAVSAAPGLSRQPRYVTTGISAAIDLRDKPGAPTSGSFVAAAFRQYSSLDGESRSFSRLAVDARAYHPVAGPRHVVAGRILASTDWTADDSPTPFYLQYSLGGSRALRGFPNYRHRGEALFLFSTEYRWHAWKFVELAPFIDAGVVAGRIGDLRQAPLHVTPGAGIRIRSEDRVFFRFDWARGAEGQRFVIALNSVF